MRKVSVIITSYNYENYIKETIESVLNQSYTDFELILVDDGSTDNSLSVINFYAQKDERIKVYTHPNQENRGLVETVKLGLEKSSGHYVAFLESDDLWSENYLEKKVEIIKKHPDFDLIYNDVEPFGNKTKIAAYGKYFKKQKQTTNKNTIYSADMCFSNIIPTFSCVMVKKETILECDFNVAVPQILDWYLWIQILKSGETAYVPLKLTKWRMHEKSYINTVSKSEARKVYEMIVDLLFEKKVPKKLIDFSFFVNTTRIEKLFRPQIQFLTKFVFKQIKKQKIKLTKISYTSY